MSDEIRGAQWQLISVEPQTNTRRLRVQGGWIYRCVSYNLDKKYPPNPTPAMVFVPDVDPESNIGANDPHHDLIVEP